jgi:galactose mutarotase-like enzyme
MPTAVSAGSFEGQPAFFLESDRFRVVVLPRVSGKIVSLVDLATNEELLWRNPERPYREPNYGDSFSDYDMSGWEDCLPNISGGQYPEHPWNGVELPDHGEVWTIPWDGRVDGDALELSVHGVRLPYRFEKRISIEDDAVRLTHRMINPTAYPMRYIWATHPLFAIRPGMRIALPDGVKMRIDSSVGWRLGGYLDELPWPNATDASGDPVALDEIGDVASGFADKLYTTSVSEGWCGLYDPATRRAIALTFDPDELPYIGVWINQGGYPGSGAPGYNVGLEPCAGYPDALDVAAERGDAATIEPGEQREWTIAFRYGEADSVQELLR